MAYAIIRSGGKQFRVEEGGTVLLGVSTSGAGASSLGCRSMPKSSFNSATAAVYAESGSSPT